MTAAVGVYGFGRIGRCTFVHITLSGRDDILAPNLNATRFIKTNEHHFEERQYSWSVPLRNNY